MSIDPHDLVRRFGSPLYVYDLALVRERARALKAAVPYTPLRWLYAVKANSCPAVLKTIAAEGFGVDAVSPGEVALALKAGIAPADVLYTENNMTDAEMQDALRAGVLINCGSLDRLRRLGQAGGREAAVRFNPDVGAGETAKTLTAGPLAKFGVHFSQVGEVRRIETETGIKVVGCHMHIGSNILDAEVYLKAMAVITATARELPHLRFIDFGGGIGVPYKPEQKPADLARLGRGASELMEAFNRAYGRRLELRLEPGRFLVAEAGRLLCTVTSVKTNPDTAEAKGRTYVGTDSGFNHLVRPTMYGSYHPIANLTNPQGKATVVDVVGNICESGDVFARERTLPEPRLGDLLAIGCAGAYGFSMASAYNLRPLPAEVTVDGDTVRLVRRRLTLDEMLAAWEW